MKKKNSQIFFKKKKGSLNHFISSCESIDQLEHVLASPQLLESGNIAICLPGDELYDEQSNKEVPLPPTKGFLFLLF